MKKLLLAGVAVGALSFATPASAEGVKLDLGGHFKGYGVYTDQDENGTQDVRDFDILRETEIHFTGETTLDNGLTVGFHAESDIDNSNGDNFNNEESYAYFSGGWGRVNFGKEDGAAYLLQVAAPSADSNIDGIRQYVQPVNYNTLFANTGASLGVDLDGDGLTNETFGNLINASLTQGGLDYDQDITDRDNKISYMTPVFQGFQAGLSYTPDLDDRGLVGFLAANAANDSRGLDGVNLDDQDGDYGDAFDVAARYEGQYDKLGFAFGAGYSTADHEGEDDLGTGTDILDDREAYNVGLDLNYGPFGLGASYSEDNNGIDDGLAGIDDSEILVIGADYTHGPYKLGASYYDQENLSSIEDLDAERWAGGVTYTYGPGMSFRGSVQYVDYEGDGANTFATGEDSADATSVLIGTQINF